MTATERGSQWLGAAHRRNGHVYHPSEVWTALERLAYAHGFNTGHRSCACHEPPPGVPANAYDLTNAGSAP